MEANESTGTGFDTREELEEDVRDAINDFLRRHGGAISWNDELMTMSVGWLDRQAEITERYWMYLNGCTIRASVEINEKLKAAETENETLRKELETVRHKCDSLQFKADDMAIRKASERREKDAQIRRLYDCVVRLKAKSKRDTDAIETLTEQLDVLCDQRATINRQRDVIDRCRIAYNAVRGLFEDDALADLGIEVPE